ncbi:hypothetical protein [Paenibacillus silagei]|uniref:DNA polymerase III delta prime subunit n=1 Tax=Paenibacillus silagei TaxID=1670801 RepID=A0ABS4P1Y5_9BACL|nr:hypothetical protein [Paenibacillus silagei]MBP2116294.1 DNA polymerase III delta prime subunit [Paenibacillus silagei]
MQPKLIFIEGLPGFGKSTTAQLIYDILAESGTKAQLFLEGNLDHPADYDGVACLTKAEYDELLGMWADSRHVLSPRTTVHDSHYLVEYRKILNEHSSRVPKEGTDIFARNDVYELSFAQNRELITARWRQFAEKALQGADTYVFDCCFIQNPVTMGMIKHGAAEEDIISYTLELEAITAGLNPLLIVIEQDDLEHSFRKAVRERPLEWSEGFIQYYTAQGYGLRQGHEGLEGTLQVLEARRELEEKIYNGLTIAKKKANNS